MTYLLIGVIGILLALIPAAFLLGVAAGYPTRRRLEREKTALLQRVSDLAGIMSTTQQSVDQLRQQVVDHYWQHSAETPAQTPTFNISPGTAGCQDCGSIIATPADMVPSEWLLAHAGHAVHIRATEIAGFNYGDIIGGD